MTFYEWLRDCMQREAIRTEPDSQKVIQRVMEELEKWKKKK